MNGTQKSAPQGVNHLLKLVKQTLVEQRAALLLLILLRHVLFNSAVKVLAVFTGYGFL